ncbi:hypothetical protein [uncultured Anaerococcus sp.]|uniref:hypothetical protein n=1 Tax=uncultured Anaerococcus sp. TaxID=293428 RepID=UPI0028898F9C|nr:hypothetical protein [uncultured Anaerococcus sp.]
MKNKMKKILLLALFALTLQACSQKTNDDASTSSDKNLETSQKESEDKAKDEKDNKEEVKKDDKKEDSAKAEDKNNDESKESPTNGTLIETDGQYASLLLAEQEGKVDQAGHATCYECLVDAATNTLTVKGSLSYNEKVDDINTFENAKTMDKMTYTFKLDENSILRSTGGTSEPKPYTAEEFNDLAKKAKDSGLGLIIVVENGVVKTVSIAS